MRVRSIIFLSLLLICYAFKESKHQSNAWIRINQLGYTPKGVKVAVWCSNEELIMDNWQLIDAASQKIVYTAKTGKALDRKSVV